MNYFSITSVPIFSDVSIIGITDDCLETFKTIKSTRLGIIRKFSKVIECTCNSTFSLILLIVI